MNAAEFNALYPVGTPVLAYPGARPEDDSNDERLITRTRSRASVLGGHTDVVWVEGHSACIALSHVDVVSESVFEAALLANAVAAQGALPMPTRPARSELEQVSEEIARFGIYGAALPAARALVKRADELVTENAQLRARLSAVLDICDREQRNAMRWENPIPVPDWVGPVQRAALGDDKRQAVAR
ncbi:hypothetical protein SGFS_013620 [Streptomyces graminofaciens]|uniref:Uncharacterized protein n=1 Tax=Streptomyces graminofaciens TaxID=68212 RepID=A0ABN5V9V3_9ACTN|nr:hypothetical protein [Streptomyces graminofaciens]BBC30068.1 hypothetical protein SGFS_013620 [Streptomyces graminofaciens]